MNAIFNIIDAVSNGLQQTRTGSYKITGTANDGGHGILYFATDLRSGKQYLLKRVHPDVKGHERDILKRRLQREASVRINSPYVITACDSGSDGQGFYAVFPIAPGKDLNAHIEEGRLVSDSEIKNILITVARGLRDIHRTGLCHRDVTPRNVVYEPRTGTVHLIDLGLVSELPASSHLTRPDRPLGTLAFASPEAVARPHRIDSRSDLHGIGCLAYWLYAAESPFEGQTEAHTIKRVMDDEPQKLTDLNPDTPAMIATLVEGLLQKKPDDRWPQTANEVVDVLQGRKSCSRSSSRSTTPLCMACGMPSPTSGICSVCGCLLADQYMLRCRLQDGRIKTFRLPIGTYPVGRNEISRSDTRLSRRQAEFMVTLNEVKVRHLDGINPTLIDGCLAHRGRMTRVHKHIQLADIAAELVPQRV